MTASLQVRNDKVYVVLSWKHGRSRKQKWVLTDLPLKYGKRIGEEKRLSVLKEWEPKICINYESIKLGDYLRDWVERKKDSVEETTYREYRRMVNNTIAPYFDESGLSLAECKVIHIESFYRKRMKEKGISANTVSHYQACLYSALKDACRLELIPSNPAEKVVLPKVKKYKGTYCTVDEINKMIEASVKTRLEIPIYLASWFGMRRGEIAGLKWENVDFEHRTLTVNGVLSYCSGTRDRVQYRDHTKSEAGMRAFPLSEAHLTMFKHWRAQQAENRLLAGGEYDAAWKEFVCVDEMGKIISPNYISWAFPIFIKKNGFRKVRFHDLRHTNAVMLLSNGASMQEVQDWLGHENYSTTDEYYGGIMAETKKHTSVILDNVLSKKKKFG